MSCGNGSCKCGSNCSCGSDCKCNTFSISETTASVQTLIGGFSPAKALYDDGMEMGVGAENDGCKCGSNCGCGADCKCGK